MKLDNNSPIVQAYHKVAKATQLGVLWLDSEGNIVAANDILLRVLRFTEKELINKTILDITPPMKREDWQQYHEQLKRFGKVETTTSYRTAEGKLYTAYTIGLLQEVDGTPYCCQLSHNVLDTNRLDDMLQLITDINRIGSFEWDIRQQLFSASDLVYDLLGFPNQGSPPIEETLSALQAKIDPDQWQKAREKWGDALQSEQRQEMELPIHLEDHQTTLFKIHLNTVFSDNQPIKVYGTIQDISAITQRSKNMYLALYSLEKASDMIFWIKKSGEIIFANEAAIRHLGYSKEELIGMHTTDITLNVSKAEWPQYWERAKEEKDMLKYESTQQAKDGTTYPVEVFKNFIQYNSDEVLCAFTRNISERKQREAELQNSLEKIEKLSQQLKEEKTYLQEEINLAHNFNEIITRNAEYKRLLKQIEQVADTQATVLITGETGTGKELLARAIHHLSGRRDRPMVKVNCAALAANLIESELFGHEKGAFTGAVKRKIGRFELADKGTIFLDEVGELPLELQTKLLRVLQEGEFERLGSIHPLRVDVRIIAATNRNLQKMVQEGEFRQDLFYRLNVFPIHNIPLRERIDDIPLLVQHFVDKYSKKINREIKKIPKSAIEKLQRYEFPGNVRELENLVERAIILSNNNTLT